MKKRILLTIATIFSLVFILNDANAQKLIARQSGTTTTFHTTLDDAITQANNDDILYIPGGYFELAVPITKKIHIYGEGHNPNYSKANGTTIIGGTGFNLSPEASGSSFQGLYISCGIAIQEQCINIMFFRCNIADISRDAENQAYREYITLTECIVRGNMQCYIKYGEFNNCFFQGEFFYYYRNCNFKNCVFLNPLVPWRTVWQMPGSVLDNSRIEKCIFLAGGIGNVSLCYLYDNIFNGATSDFPVDGTNVIGTNNKYKPQVEIFEEQSGNAFNYEHNYHQKNEPTDLNLIIGIHGGPSPWKDNCFPLNPQIISKKIAGYTDASGNLKVEISVEAQQK